MVSYIVRIYHYEEGSAGGVAGIVEKVGCPDKKPFNNIGELWEILKDKDMDRQSS